MVHDIEVRKIPFEFDNIDPVWHPLQPEWSHLMNGASLTMPYLEPFLNRTLRAAIPQLEDEALRKDVDGFIRQEAQHFGNHRRYNEMLKAKGYAGLSDVEATFTTDYERIEQMPLDWRLAYAAGFETMTMGVTEWLVNDRDALFSHADPVVTSLVLWHMVEETEHKSVAYDVYQAVSGRYWLRLYGLVWGSLHVGLMSRRAYREMLIQDGRWNNWRSRLKVWQRVGKFFLKAGPAMIRALNPNYHPDKVQDPAWVAQWRAAYSQKSDATLPVLETDVAGIPPVFAAVS